MELHNVECCKDEETPFHGRAHLWLVQICLKAKFCIDTPHKCYNHYSWLIQFNYFIIPCVLLSRVLLLSHVDHPWFIIATSVLMHSPLTFILLYVPCSNLNIWIWVQKECLPAWSCQMTRYGFKYSPNFCACCREDFRQWCENRIKHTKSSMNHIKQ